MLVCAKCGYDPAAAISQGWASFIARRAPSMNDRLANVGARRFLYREERDAWCWHFRVMRLEHRIPFAVQRRRVTLTRLYCGRERDRDRDNLIGGMKAVVDAMVRERLLLDDTSAGAEIYYAQHRDECNSGLNVELDEFAP